MTKVRFGDLVSRVTRKRKIKTFDPGESLQKAWEKKKFVLLMY